LKRSEGGKKECDTNSVVAIRHNAVRKDLEKIRGVFFSCMKPSGSGTGNNRRFPQVWGTRPGSQKVKPTRWRGENRRKAKGGMPKIIGEESSTDVDHAWDCLTLGQPGNQKDHRKGSTKRGNGYATATLKTPLPIYGGRF